MATIAAENLLKAVLELNENGETVIAARLACFLKISSAAVRRFKKLEELWRRMPEYLDKGSEFVDMAADFLERMGEQAEQAGRQIAHGKF